MITFLNYFDCMSGTYTSVLDLYNGLKQYVDCKHVFVIKQENFNVLKKYKKYLPKTNIYFIHKFPSISTDILICSGYYFKQISRNIIQPLPITYKKLIVLDCTSFTFSHYTKEFDIFDTLSSFKNKIILGNKFNSQFFSDKEYRLYYHVIDFSRLDSYINKNNKKELTVDNYSKCRYMDVDPYVYNKYVYNRWINITNDIYYENIGKLIFEYNYMGKKVEYNLKNKCFDDGLTEYLSLMQIDDSYNQNIFIPKQNLDLLKFSSDNYIFNEI